MRRVIVNSTPLIALCNADLILLDDNAAKKTAKFLGLKVTGTVDDQTAQKLGII